MCLDSFCEYVHGYKQRVQFGVAGSYSLLFVTILYFLKSVNITVSWLVAKANNYTKNTYEKATFLLYIVLAI